MLGSWMLSWGPTITDGNLLKNMGSPRIRDMLLIAVTRIVEAHASDFVGFDDRG
jgi:hypothetical protein